MVGTFDELRPDGKKIYGWVLNDDTGLDLFRWGEEPLLSAKYTAAMWSIMTARFAHTNTEFLFSTIAQLVTGFIYGEYLLDRACHPLSLSIHRGTVIRVRADIIGHARINMY